LQLQSCKSQHFQKRHAEQLPFGALDTLGFFFLDLRATISLFRSRRFLGFDLHESQAAAFKHPALGIVVRVQVTAGTVITHRVPRIRTSVLQSPSLRSHHQRSKNSRLSALNLRLQHRLYRVRSHAFWVDFFTSEPPYVLIYHPVNFLHALGAVPAGERYELDRHGGRVLLALATPHWSLFSSCW
jgi:hypothetical protein